MRDISLSEDIFVREEVSSEETFKVSGLPLKPIIGGVGNIRLTVSKVGLYQINSTMEEWAEDLLSRLVSERSALGRPLTPQEVGPICDKDPEWVNDDSGLIAQCLRSVSDSTVGHTVALISGDRRLGNQMAETCNVTVVRIRPRDYAVACYREGLDPKLPHMRVLQMHVGYRLNLVLVDTGSISADAVHMAEEDNRIFKRSVTQTGWQNGRRFSKINLVEATARQRFKTEAHRPVSRPRVWRQGSRPAESVYSSHSSWKRSTTRSSNSSWWRNGPPPSIR